MDRLTDRLNMTIVIDWDVKQHSNKQSIFGFYFLKLDSSS